MNTNAKLGSGLSLVSCYLLLGLAPACSEDATGCRETRTCGEGTGDDGGGAEEPEGGASGGSPGAGGQGAAGGNTEVGPAGDGGQVAAGGARAEPDAGAGGEGVAVEAGVQPDGEVAPSDGGAVPQLPDGSSALPEGAAPEAGPALDRCAEGFLDCNGSSVDGCEVDPRSDLLHCGACQHECADTNATRAACVEGACKPRCAAGFASCETPAAPAADDGCETDLRHPASCGACGRDCLGGTCAAGVCEPYTVAEAGDFARSLVVASGYVYWAEGGVLVDESGGHRGSLDRVSREGGAVERLREGYFSYIASDGEHLYGVELDLYAGDAVMQSRAEVIRMHLRTGVTTGWLDGGSVYKAPNVFDFAPGIIAVSRSAVAWFDVGRRQISLLPKATIDQQLEPTAITREVPVPSALHLEEHQLFVGATQGIVRGEMVDEPAQPFASGADPCFAVDGTHVYYGAPSGIARRLKAGGSEDVLVPLGEAEGPFVIALGPRSAYYASRDGVFAVAKAGGRPTRVAPAPDHLGYLVYQDGVLFWMDQGETADSRVIRAVVP